MLVALSLYRRSCVSFRSAAFDRIRCLSAMRSGTMIFRGNHFVLWTLSEAAQSQAVVPIASLESTGQCSNSPSIFSQGQPAVSSADRQVRRISPYPEESEFLENLL